MKEKIKSLHKNTKNNLVTYGMVILVYAVVQLLSFSGGLSNLMEGLLVPICTYVILAVSLNLTVGILGELSLGHAGFMCIGAFSSALFSKCMENIITISGIRFFLAILIGAVVAGFFGFLIGIPVLRLRGDYLAIVTLAFGEIIKNVINVIYLGRDNAGIHFSMKGQMALGMAPDGELLIKGPQGITGTPNDSTFTIGVVLILLTIFIITNLLNSRTGRAVTSIRDNRIAAESIGINITKYKLITFSVSAALAGVAGVLNAHNLSTLPAKNFGYNMSIMILVFVVLGGMGNIRGSIISAVLLTLLPEVLRGLSFLPKVLRGLSDYRMLIYAIILIVMMIYNWSPAFIGFRKRYLSREAFKDNFGKKKEA